MVGDTLHGHIAGWFGRDFYGCVRIEAMGADWVVARYLNTGIAVATAASHDFQGLYKAMAWARDRFDEGFCGHERPDVED
jgi:hypothetical protein